MSRWPEQRNPHYLDPDERLSSAERMYEAEQREARRSKFYELGPPCWPDMWHQGGDYRRHDGDRHDCFFCRAAEVRDGIDVRRKNIEHRARWEAAWGHIANKANQD